MVRKAILFLLLVSQGLNAPLVAQMTVYGKSAKWVVATMNDKCYMLAGHSESIFGLSLYGQGNYGILYSKTRNVTPPSAMSVSVTLWDSALKQKYRALKVFKMSFKKGRDYYFGSSVSSAEYNLIKASAFVTFHERIGGDQEMGHPTKYHSGDELLWRECAATLP